MTQLDFRPPFQAARSKLSSAIGRSVSIIAKSDSREHNRLSRNTPADEKNGSEEAELEETFDHTYEKVDGTNCFERYRIDLFNRMDKYLAEEYVKWLHYSKLFEDQHNVAMATRFAFYASEAYRNLELLDSCWAGNLLLPRHGFVIVNFSSVPFNPEIRRGELHIIVKALHFGASDPSKVYCVGEFEEPTQVSTSILDTLRNWSNTVLSYFGNAITYSALESNQLDLVRAISQVPFNGSSYDSIEFDRPLIFHFERRSISVCKATKFKPIKLSFYQRSKPYRRDRRLGWVQLKLDAMKDYNSIATKMMLRDGDENASSLVQLRVKVREPLVKSIRAIAEKHMILFEDHPDHRFPSAFSQNETQIDYSSDSVDIVE